MSYWQKPKESAIIKDGVLEIINFPQDSNNNQCS